MLIAAAEAGLKALGVDTCEVAVRQARACGAVVLHGSIFSSLPQEGRWGSALLLDGNVGIGGNVAALLTRLAQLVCPDGSVLADVDPQPDLDLSYVAVLEDAAGHLSEPFAWSRVGAESLAMHAAVAGWRITSMTRSSNRAFCQLHRL
ncbi:MAG: hypothetical protein M3017_12960 [Actinomycetota bacterium]|nr:hypothetical protein [Actinomycetota bacterium]